MKASAAAMAAFVASLVVALVLTFAPLDETCGPTRPYVCTDASIVEANGSGARTLVAMFVPAALALAGVLVRRSVVRGVVAAVLWICCGLAILSVGIVFVPAAILMTIAAVMRDRDLVTT